MSIQIHVKRIYDDPADEDGYRVLIDRLWPRGVRKEDAHFDAWVKDLAPSSELRQWFAHDPARFRDFGVRYRRELADHRRDLDELLAAAGPAGSLTLLYAAADPVHNHAVVLRACLLEVAGTEAE